jgi:LemA protein
MSPASLAALFAVVLAFLIVAFLALATYNAIVDLRLRIDKAWSNIDVALKQRYDQLPNLVKAVRGVMSWEQNVLTDVATARAAYSPSAPIPDQAATSAATSSAVRSLFAVVERYPEVRSAANVLDLQQEIERLEAMIADRRELYNDQVYRYNTRIAQVPAVLLAGLFRWRARPFFEAPEADRGRPDAALRPDPTP